MIEPTRPAADLLQGPQQESAIRALLAQRDQLQQRRWQRRLMIAMVISLVCHGLLMVYLSMVNRLRPGGSEGDSVTIEFAVLPSSQLDDSGSPSIQPLALESTASTALEPLTAPDPLADAITMPPTQGLTPSTSAQPTLGGSGQGSGGGGSGTGFGSGSGDGIGGGAGGTSFFGISSKGSRFAYIVDRSSSMLRQDKIGVAKRELARSVQSLPDYAYFHVVFFSTGLMTLDTDELWLRARPGAVNDFLRWLDKKVFAEGGTIPRLGFEEVFSLPVRPDVIFFMTDGEIIGFTAQEVEAMNRQGKHVIINTIAFGDPASQDLLQQIARDSGGVYRFVPVEGW